MTEIKDTELLEALKQGDDQAFNILFSRYWKQIYAVAYHRLRDEQDADDLVQELFISLWERRADIVIKSNIENYLMGAIKFKIISRIRIQAVKADVFEELKKRMYEIEQQGDELIDHDLLEETLNDAMHGLNGNVKTAFIMRSDNMSVRDIAVQMDLKEQTVRNYIAIAVEHMRAAVKQKYPQHRTLCAALSASLIHHYLT